MKQSNANNIDKGKKVPIASRIPIEKAQKLSDILVSRGRFIKNNADLLRELVDEFLKQNPEEVVVNNRLRYIITLPEPYKYSKKKKEAKKAKPKEDGPTAPAVIHTSALDLLMKAKENIK